MSKETTNKFARIISTLFVPPAFTIIYFSIFAFEFEIESTKRIATILVALVFGFIAPIVLFLILRNKGKLADQDASIKEERTFPFLIAIVFYLTGLFFMIKFGLNIISIAFWFCYISNTIITIFINKYWKISAHAMGATGPFAAIVFTFGWIGILMLPIVILVGWSRIKLKCHTLPQVLAGSLLAFFSVYVQMSMIVNYLFK
ncbi:MAG: PAP2 family protein [Ignavibacteriales bacterium]|nr:PAP2 family protein [Ignavibacteriales bacterium]